MADYKYRATSKAHNRANHRGSAGLWFFGGFISGAFLMGLAVLKLGPELSAGRVPGVTPPVAAPSREPGPRSAPKPQFEFYTILPEMEVVIPDEEVLPPRESAAAPPAAEAPPEQPASKGAYVLQMGSFRKHADAERMKASLALIGIEAKIQKVSINNQDTYHRVRSGPYRSQAELERIRKLARDNNIKSLVIKLKG